MESEVFDTSPVADGELLQPREAIQRVLAAQTYYQVLGVVVDATPHDITRAYRKTILLVHPDKTTEEGADKAFRRVHEAFICLSNDRARAEYNESGAGDVDVFREQANKQAASSRESIEQSMQLLDSLGIQLPPEEYRVDFVEFVDGMIASGRLQTIYNRWALASTAVLVVSGVIIPVSLPMYALIISLGPMAIGPAIAWEQVLSEFDRSSLSGRVVSSQFFHAIGSMASSTARLTLVWSVCLGALVVSVPVTIVRYVADQLGRANIDSIETWEITDIDSDGTPRFHSATTNPLSTDTNDSSGSNKNGEVLFADEEPVAIPNKSQPSHDDEYDQLDSSEEDAQPWTLVDYIPPVPMQPVPTPPPPPPPPHD